MTRQLSLAQTQLLGCLPPRRARRDPSHEALRAMIERNRRLTLAQRDGRVYVQGLDQAEFERCFRQACLKPSGGEYSHSWRALLAQDFNHFLRTAEKRGLIAPGELWARNYRRAKPALVVDLEIFLSIPPSLPKRLADQCRKLTLAGRPVCPPLGDRVNALCLFMFSAIYYAGLCQSGVAAALLQVPLANVWSALTQNFMRIPRAGAYYRVPAGEELKVSIGILRQALEREGLPLPVDLTLAEAVLRRTVHSTAAAPAVSERAQPALRKAMNRWLAALGRQVGLTGKPLTVNQLAGACSLRTQQVLGNVQTACRRGYHLPAPVPDWQQGMFEQYRTPFRLPRVPRRPRRSHHRRSQGGQS